MAVSAYPVAAAVCCPDAQLPCGNVPIGSPGHAGRLGRVGWSVQPLKQAAKNCDPAFNNEAGERSATRLIADAIVREHRYLESRGRGRPWISPRLARWHRPPQRCSFCSLLPSALSHHDMSYSATADWKQGNPARAHAGHCTPMQFAVRQGARGPAGPEDPGERSPPLADSERVACALNARPHGPDCGPS